ncbi:hepatitis A virus cellular receptor 1 [Lycaon pictus]
MTSFFVRHFEICIPTFGVVKTITIMQHWVAISSLILLLTESVSWLVSILLSCSIFSLFTDAVVSYVQVNGVVGHPATLPCTYSTAHGVTTMCWGRGACPISHCLEEIVWTNGSHVTFQKHLRYKLKGKLSEGDVSLTIENAAQTDSGQYCCRVEHRGWFNDMKLTLSLEIKPAEVTSVPTSPRVFTSTSSTPAPTQNLKPDGNGTVTQSSDGLWHNNQTHVSLAQNPWMTTSKGLYIGICITAVVLLTVLVVVITKKYLCIRNKLEQLNMVSLNDSQTGALQSAAEVGVQAEDNIYIIEDNLYVMD